MPRWHKWLVSAFIVLNLSAVVQAHVPRNIRERIDTVLSDHASRLPARAAIYANWLLARYGYRAGLDNRWEMFGELPRFDWWYVIKAQYEDRTERILPLPLQGERSFMERHFFDHKEVKFHLNLYNRQEERLAYGRYLCRMHSSADNPVRFVVIELHFQHIRPRDAALRAGHHLDGPAHRRLLNLVRCS